MSTGARAASVAQPQRARVAENRRMAWVFMPFSLPHFGSARASARTVRAAEDRRAASDERGARRLVGGGGANQILVAVAAKDDF